MVPVMRSHQPPHVGHDAERGTSERATVGKQIGKAEGRRSTSEQELAQRSRRALRHDIPAQGGVRQVELAFRMDLITVESQPVDCSTECRRPVSSWCAMSPVDHTSAGGPHATPASREAMATAYLPWRGP
jgi:hypothetical protein